jgi:hypothetical protein
VHVDLNQRRIAYALEAVDLSSLDDEDVSGTGLELPTVHVIERPPLPHELHLVVRVPMWPRAATGGSGEEESGDVDVPIVGPDEVMRAAVKGQVFLANMVHVIS